MNKQKEAERRKKMTANAIAMFSFREGQKVHWDFGKYDYYFITRGYMKGEEKFYNITDPYGQPSLHIKEEELRSYH